MLIAIPPYVEPAICKPSNISQCIPVEDELEVKIVIREIFNAYGLYDENLLPGVVFEELPHNYWGLYSQSNHLIKIDALKTNSIVGTAKHEAVHAMIGILRQKILLENPELYRNKIVDGLINAFKNPPGSFFLTKDYKVIRPGLSEVVLAKVKKLLLDPNLNLSNHVLTAKTLKGIGLQSAEVDYIAHLAAVSTSLMQMKEELKKSINSLKLTRKQLDLAVRSIEEYPKFNSTLEKNDYITHPPKLNFLDRWLTPKSWRMWHSNICSQESKAESYREYLKNLEEILARLAELPPGETKDKLFDLVKIYRSRSNRFRRARLIEDIKDYTKNITDTILKSQFEALISKFQEDTLQEIFQSIKEHHSI